MIMREVAAASRPDEVQRWAKGVSTASGQGRDWSDAIYR